MIGLIEMIISCPFKNIEEIDILEKSVLANFYFDIYSDRECYK